MKPPVSKLAAVFCAINLCAAGNVYSQQEITRPATLSAKIPARFEGPLQEKIKELAALEKQIKQMRTYRINRWHREAEANFEVAAAYVASVLPEYEDKVKLRALLDRLSDTKSPSEEIYRDVANEYGPFLKKFIDARSFNHSRRPGLRQIRYLIWLHRVYPSLLGTGADYGAMSRELNLDSNYLWQQWHRIMRLGKLSEKIQQRERLKRELLRLRRSGADVRISRLLQAKERKLLELEALDDALAAALAEAMRRNFPGRLAAFSRRASVAQNLNEFTRVVTAVEISDGSITRAAAKLRENRSTFFYKIEKYGLTGYVALLRLKRQVKNNFRIVEELIRSKGKIKPAARNLRTAPRTVYHYVLHGDLLKDLLPLDQLNEDDEMSAILLHYLHIRSGQAAQRSFFQSA